MNTKIDGSYEVAIIGSGVIGLFIAYELSKYSTKTIVIDSNPEPGFGVSKYHAGVIHVIQLPLGSLKSRLALYGNRMYDKICRELKVDLKRVSAILVASRVRDLIYLPILYILIKLYYGAKGFKVSFINPENLKKIEPNVAGYCGIGVDGYGIIDSFRLIYRLYSTSRMKGIHFIFNNEVKDIHVHIDHIELELEDGSRIRCRFLVNASGLSSVEITRKIDPKYSLKPAPKPGAMVVFDRAQTKNIVAPIKPSIRGETKGGGIIPTIWGTTIWGPSIDKDLNRVPGRSTPKDLYNLIKKFRDLIKVKGHILKVYVGLRPSTDKGDFYIEYSKRSSRIVNLIGIESPGLTAAPAIAKIVVWMLWKSGLKLKPLGKYTRSKIRINDKKHIEIYPEDSHDIVCACMNVSLGDLKQAVIDGVSTLDGLCFYTKLGMGTCQGQNCLAKAIIELSKLLRLHPRDLNKGGKNSWLVK